MKSLFMILVSLFLFSFLPTTTHAQLPGWEKTYQTANGKFVVVSNFGACATHVLTKEQLDIIQKEKDEKIEANEKKYNIKFAGGLVMRCDTIQFPYGNWITVYHFFKGFFELKTPARTITILHLYNQIKKPVFIGYTSKRTAGGKLVEDQNTQWIDTLKVHPPLPSHACINTKPVQENYYHVNSPCVDSIHVGYVHANPKTGKLEYVKSLPKKFPAKKK